MKTRLCVLVLLSIMASGCGSMMKSREHLGAQPLEVTPANLSVASGDKRSFIGGIALDSAKKCDAFISVLTDDQASVNAGGSITSTVFTALATLVTPIRTAHALSAGATIASGTRDAINANLYNKGTTAAFHTALQSTYYKNLNQYLDALSVSDESSLNVGVEAAKLQTIHATCSLAAAEASILATIQPPPGPDGSTSSAGGAAVPSSPTDNNKSAPSAPSAPSGNAPSLPMPKTRGAVSGARIWN